MGDVYTEAQQAEALITMLRSYTASAVNYGNVNRKWANAQLIQLGAEPLSGSSTTAEYRVNAPMTGLFGMTVHAKSRTEALELLRQRAARQDKINDHNISGVSVYRVDVDLDAATFHSGPEDVVAESVEPLSLDALRSGIRAMLREGVSVRDWGHSYANAALGDMGLDLLPSIVFKAVEVPVTGTALVNIRLFEGDGDDEVQAAAVAVASKFQTLSVKPEEIGTAVLSGA